MRSAGGLSMGALSTGIAAPVFDQTGSEREPAHVAAPGELVSSASDPAASAAAPGGDAAKPCAL
jgi:hypothetical protein